MKRVLFIATTNLFERNGGAIGQLAYYKSVKEIFENQIDLMMPVSGNESYPDIIGVPQRSLWDKLLSGSIHRYKKFVKKYLSEHKGIYDCCVICNGIYAGDMVKMIKSKGIKVMVIYQDYEPQYQMDNKTMYSFYGTTSFLIKRNEKSAYMHADVNCFMSIEDVQLFEENYGKTKTPYVVVGCYEKEQIDFVEPPKKNIENKTLCIIGSMNVFMSINGVVDFKNRYFDIFRKECPDWKIIIAGRDPSAEIYDFQKEYSSIIKVIPNPDDMNKVIESALIFFSPTNLGGGIKTRLMDGLRRGIPVLTHKISARGYQSIWDKSFFQIYDDEVSFKNGLNNLLNYLKDNYSPYEVYKDYMRYFSFEAGTQRFRDAFKLIF